MSAWEVVLLEQGIPGRTLEPPEVPAAFATVPSPGDVIRGQDDDAVWKVMRIEHGETAPLKLEAGARETLERLGTPASAAYLGPRPTCRVLVRPAGVWSEADGKHMLLGLQWPDRATHNEVQPYDQSWTRGYTVCLAARPQITCRIVSIMVDKPTAENWTVTDLRIGKTSLCASAAGLPLKPFAVEHAVLEQMEQVTELHMAQVGKRESDGARLPGLSDPIVPLFDLGVATPGLDVSLLVQNITGSEVSFCGGLLVERAYLGGEQW